jgi:hypothetical protein
MLLSETKCSQRLKMKINFMILLGNIYEIVFPADVVVKMMTMSVEYKSITIVYKNPYILS